MAEKQSSVLMLPWLAHGHISPFLELAKKLAKRNFFIYLCSTPTNLTSIKKRLTENESLSIQLVELHLPSLPDLPPHYHTTNGLPTHLMTTLKQAFELSSPNFSNILKTLKPDLLIYDFNQPWASSIASSHNIPSVQFIIFGSAFISFVLHMINNPSLQFPFPAIYLREPERPAFRGLIDASANEVTDGERFLQALQQSCNVVLIKSLSREIERKYLDYFSVLANKKIVSLGPLVQDPVNIEDECIEIMQWLDKKDESCSVFVCFGSEYFLSREEMEELAHGLELSKVNFIWVVRFPMGERIRVEEALPEGYLERVGGRGMVIEGWAPQAKILGHPSTGGFVSHCGWSSVMESIKFGVPIIAMPMHIDQPLNARFVEEIGVGVEVKRGSNERLEREEIAKVIRKVVVDKNGENIRSKAREMREHIRLKGEEEIDGVAEEFIQLCKQKQQYKLLNDRSNAYQ
ncbi:UDP-glucosyltransferase 29-like [Cornus florida]|uniref:UDP-glucosyltransferase 29-like n=1 Tax=Cornus florida TaxID=4283 RepID=UPI0028A1C6FC|nr:UDP-glucosyltransferase 29-like [Cornus florida]